MHVTAKKNKFFSNQYFLKAMNIQKRGNEIQPRNYFQKNIRITNL